MVTSVVDDHGDFLSAPILARKETIQEAVEGNPIEFAFFGFHVKASGSDVHCSPVSDLRPGRSRGDLGLGATRPPHTDYTGTLLKMDFVLSKDPDMRISKYPDQFFLKAACASTLAPFGEVRGRNRRKSR
jgi:hypothetical protein